MAKKTVNEAAAKLSYKYFTEVHDNSRIICGKSGVNKLFKEITNADVEKMLAAGNKNWTAIS